MQASSNLLNWILWMPFIGVLGILFIPKAKETAIRVWSLINTTVTFALTLVLYAKFDTTVPGMQVPFNISVPWIKSFNIFYKLGVDGISLPMIVLTGLLFLICVLSSWTVKKQVKAYFAPKIVRVKSLNLPPCRARISKLSIPFPEA